MLWSACWFLQARLSGPYIRKWITGRGDKPGSTLTLEDPGDGVLRPGQIICIKAPTKRGRPIHMALQKHEAALSEAAVRFVSSDAAGTSVYALCVTIPLPVGENSVRGQLSIDFEDGNASTAQEVTLTGYDLCILEHATCHKQVVALKCMYSLA